MAAPRTFIQNDPHHKGMQKTRSALLVILMMTVALAGCISEDTSDLDTQIEDLGTQNTELTQTIAERDLAISELEAAIAGLESNVAGLEASIPLMEEQRDALLALLSDSQEFANQTLELAEAMNETIAALHVMLGENATQVLQLQIDVHEWQQTAEGNRAVINGELSGNPPGSIPSIIIYSKLRNADFRELRMSYLHWVEGNFSGANIPSADIYEVSFLNGDLQGVDFSYTDFSGVDIIGTSLQGVDFRSAFLRNVDFVDSDLNGADLTDLSHQGVTWANTICPDGTNSDDNGGTCWNNI